MTNGSTPDLPLDLFNIDKVELAVLYMFCREPTAVTFFVCPASDILNPITRKVVDAAQKISKVPDPNLNVPTIDLISAKTGLAIDDLDHYSKMVTNRMREDWLRYAPLIRLAAQKRRIGDWLVEAEDQLMRVPLLDMPKWNAQKRAEFAELVIENRGEESAEIGDILIQAETQPLIYLDPIATGVPVIDVALNGGPRPNQILVLGGAFGSGKTTIARNFAINMEKSRGMHIAADGGNRFEHLCYYIAMRAKRHCLRDGVSTEIYGHRGDALHPDNVAIWLANRNPENQRRELLTPIIPKVELALLAAREELLNLRQSGYFSLYDMAMIGTDIDNLVSFIEKEYYTNDCQYVLIDHIGKFGDKRKQQFFDRFETNAQLLVDLFNRLPLIGIFLAQRTAKGVDKHNTDKDDEDDDTDYSAHIEGGRVWQQEAHSVWISRRPSGKPLLKIKAKKLRKAENMMPTASIPFHPPSGLILPHEPGQREIAGYA